MEWILHSDIVGLYLSGKDSLESFRNETCLSVPLSLYIPSHFGSKNSTDRIACFLTCSDANCDIRVIYFHVDSMLNNCTNYWLNRCCNYYTCEDYIELLQWSENLKAIFYCYVYLMFSMFCYSVFETWAFRRLAFWLYEGSKPEVFSESQVIYCIKWLYFRLNVGSKPFMWNHNQCLYGLCGTPFPIFWGCQGSYCKLWIRGQFSGPKGQYLLYLQIVCWQYDVYGSVLPLLYVCAPVPWSV